MRYMEELKTSEALKIAKNISIIIGIPSLFLVVLFALCVWILRNF
jgi:hypothetical protein